MVQENPGSPKKDSPFSGSQLLIHHRFIPHNKQANKKRRTTKQPKNNKKNRNHRTSPTTKQKTLFEIRVATMGGLLGVFLEGN